MWRVLCVFLIAWPARADAPSLRLAPTAESVQEARTRRLEQRLTRTLASWPGVEQAEVALQLPLVSEQPLDRELPPPSATVVLRRADAAGPAHDDIAALLMASVPALTPERIRVLDQRPAAVPSSHAAWARVGPFRVAPESAPWLRLALLFSLAMHAALAAIVLWRLRRVRPPTRKVDPRARASLPP